jgi:CRP-like cAMP-binding protein
MLKAKRVRIENSLLASLPDKDYQRLLPGLELVTLPFGKVLYEPGSLIKHVYFPNSALVSLLTLADGHLALEVGMVGYEGMIGTQLALGIKVSSVRTLVQGSGTAMRMTSGRFRKEFRQSPPLQLAMFHYLHVLMAQISQTAACNRFHEVEERLARWLLMTRDRVRSNQFVLTQEFLSHMLGVRRVGVTGAARALQQKKLISYNRGNMKLLDYNGLKAAACGCYRTVKAVQQHAEKLLAQNNALKQRGSLTIRKR